MRLTFSNIGRFVEKTEVDINGITVIAGVNGTGKSTISKLLYCIFDSLHDTDRQIEKNRISSIERILSRPIRRKGQFLNTYKIAYEVVSQLDAGASKADITEILNKNDYSITDIDEVVIDEVLDQIVGRLAITDGQVLEELVLLRFIAEFGKCLQHVNFTDKESKVDLLIRDKHIDISIEDGGFSVNSEFELVKDIVYLDDLSAVANVSLRTFSRLGYNLYSHNVRLTKKIYEARESDDDVLDRIIAEKRYSSIVSKLNQLEVGDLVKSNSGDMEYYLAGLKSNLGMQNVSAGTKVLAVIKKLILNGYIEENGIIVLDEPEVHLHPEWQKALAEIIAVMQSEMGVNVLINTHSADFVAFIQYYTEKMDLVQKCKYYRAVSNDDYTSSIIDVTDDVQEIYGELGLPFIRVTEEISE